MVNLIDIKELIIKRNLLISAKLELEEKISKQLSDLNLTEEQVLQQTENQRINVSFNFD